MPQQEDGTRGRHREFNSRQHSTISPLARLPKAPAATRHLGGTPKSALGVVVWRSDSWRRHALRKTLGVPTGNQPRRTGCRWRGPRSTRARRRENQRIKKPSASGAATRGGCLCAGCAHAWGSLTASAGRCKSQEKIVRQPAGTPIRGLKWTTLDPSQELRIQGIQIVDRRCPAKLFGTTIGGNATLSNQNTSRLKWCPEWNFRRLGYSLCHRRL
jgi:hypothetical protein